MYQGFLTTTNFPNQGVFSATTPFRTAHKIKKN